MSANVIMDRFSGQSRGFGFVEMSMQDEAQAAIAKLDGQPFGGRRLKVAMANPSAVRSDRPRKEMIGGGSLFLASDTEARVRQTLRDCRPRSDDRLR